MANTFTHGLQKLLAILLVGLLALSFVAWGIADVFTPQQNTDVVEIGDSILSREAWRNEVNRRLRMQRAMGQTLSEAERQALSTEVLEQLIHQRLLQMASHDMGLTVSDFQLAETIRRIPALQGENGQLDAQLLERYLQSVGTSKAQFVAQIRQEQQLQQLLQAALAVPFDSNVLLRLEQEYALQQRDIRMLILPDTLIQDVPDPTGTELLSYYDQRREAFNAPEYRLLRYVILSPDSAAATANVDEAALQEAYQTQLGRFSHPKRYRFHHVSLASEEAAKALVRAVSEGKPFFESAKDIAGITLQEELEFGTYSQQELEQQGILSQEGVQTLFALTSGQVSAPIETMLGWSVFQVAHVQPSHVQPLEEVRDMLQEELEAVLADELLYRLSTDLEDMLAGGASLEETAAYLQLPLRSVPAVDQNGKGRGGQAVDMAGPHKAWLLEAAFALPDSGVSDLLMHEDGRHYAIVEVTDREPARPRALDEVRGRVLDLWKQDARMAALKEKAENLATQLQEGQYTSLEAALRKDATMKKHASIVTHEGLTRFSTPQGVPAKMVAEIFAQDVGGTSSAHLLPGKQGYAIALLQAIEPVANTPDPAQQSQLREALQQELFTQYVAYLRTQYPVTILDASVTLP